MQAWLLAGSIAPHAFGRRHWSIAKAWASTPGFRNGGGFRNARWRFRNGLFRLRRDGAGSTDDPDWTWRRLLLAHKLLTRRPVQHPPSVHRASGPSVFSWCSVPNDNNWLRRQLDISNEQAKSRRVHAPRVRLRYSPRSYSSLLSMGCEPQPPSEPAWRGGG
jgi:hypothetical protein